MRKTLIALLTAVATLVVAPPAAAQPMDYTDVRLALSVGKAAWNALDRDEQVSICGMWYVDPPLIRNEMARILRNNFPGDYISVYDSKRAANRLMNWAC